MIDAAVAAAVDAAQQAATAAVQQAVATQNGQWATALDQLMSDLYPRVVNLEQSNAMLQQELQSARTREEKAVWDAARWKDRVEALEQYLPMFESRLAELSWEAREEATRRAAEAVGVEKVAAAPVAAPAPDPVSVVEPGWTPVAEEAAKEAWFAKLQMPPWGKKAGVAAAPERETADVREAAAKSAAESAKAAADLDEEDCDVNPFLPKEATRHRSATNAAEKPMPTAGPNADEARSTEATGEGADAGEAAGEEVSPGGQATRLPQA